MRRRERRGSSPPKGDGSEVVEVRSGDGRALAATVREPPRTMAFAGTAVLAHAMFARRSEFERPAGGGLARFLSARGWRTIAFDFRGHGGSGPAASDGATWSYDDLVARDLPAVVDAARARGRGAKVVVVGHSLGGHVALAAQGTRAMEADAIALVGANLWLRDDEPHVARWLAKRALLRVVASVTRRRGFFPARALGLGSDDEARDYMDDLCRFARDGAWASRGGRVDYRAALADVKVPLRVIVSDGDAIQCPPECATRFMARAAGACAVDRLRTSDDGSAAPGHMEMITTDRAIGAFARLERWMRDGA